jgi:RHS repeat-associated protein
MSSPDASATYVWDANTDHLLGFSHRSHAATDVVASFAYDASGQRTQSVVTSGSVTTTNTYLYEGLQLFKLVSATPSKTTTLTYMYDELGRAVGMTAQVDGNPMESYTFATTDRGDVIGVSTIFSMAYNWAYDPYGNVIASAPSGFTGLPDNVDTQCVVTQPLRYAGYVYDSFSGLYYCSQRYYDPATMQFMSRDALTSDGEESAYQYCKGDPIGLTDSNGSEPHGFNMCDGLSPSGYSHGHDSHHTDMRAAIKYADDLLAHKRAAEEEYQRYLAQQAAEERAAREKAIAAARAKAKLAAMRAAVAKNAALAAQYAAEAQNWQVAADAARNVGYVCDGVVLACGALAGVAAIAGANAALQQGIEDAASDVPAEVPPPAPEPSCFVRGTPVLTASGLVAIDALKPGTLVLTGDPASGVTAYRPILRTFVHESSELMHIDVAGDPITCTPSHPFWVEGHGWTLAGALAAGDVLELASGQRAAIVSVTREELSSPVDVYNIEVADYHTYFVASVGVWVHNNCAMDTGSDSGPQGHTTSDQDAVFKRLAQYHGIDEDLAGERLHAIKNQVDIGGRNVVFDWTGNVYNPFTGENLGSLTQGGAGRKW